MSRLASALVMMGVVSAMIAAVVPIAKPQIAPTRARLSASLGSVSSTKYRALPKKRPPTAQTSENPAMSAYSSDKLSPRIAHIAAVSINAGSTEMHKAASGFAGSFFEAVKTAAVQIAIRNASRLSSPNAPSRRIALRSPLRRQVPSWLRRRNSSRPSSGP